MHIDDINYQNDQRVRDAGKNEIPTIWMDDAMGVEMEVELPWCWGVCHTCNGKGSHVNPSIDCNGLSADDFADDPDFAEEYMSGTYDQKCSRCNGRTTIPVVDHDACTDEQRAAWEQQQQDDADSEATRMAEIRMGA